MRKFNQLFNTLLLLSISVAFTACNKKELVVKDQQVNIPATGNTNATLSTNAIVTGEDRMWIAAANMSTGRIEMYDPAATDWNVPAALLWSWKPTTALGYTAAEVSAWGDPLDVKQRRVLGWSGTYLSVVGGSLASIVSYPDGTKKWAKSVGSYPHAAEILPNGNIAIAALSGNWIRVYASSQGASNGTYAQFDMVSPRGTVYDPINNVLWVLGHEFLKALTIGGTAANPTLTEVTARSSSLPTTAGTDISPYYGDLDKLWISTTQGGVYIYSKSAKTFTAVSGAAFRTSVNGISNQPNGQIVEARPSTQCTYNTWCTPTVDFYNSAGVLEYSRTVTGASFSRARTITPYYQTRSEYAIATYNVRRTTAADVGNLSWTVRRPLIAAMVMKYNFDIFGVQEPIGAQIDNMEADLTTYDHFGVSDHNDQAYQHQDIFYKKSRFTLLSSGQFWMAPGGPTTPPATRPWDNAYDACVCTWGKFEDKSTGKQFYVFNAHLDPDGEVAKTESANVILSKIPQIAGTSPVLLMGDLNANQYGNTTTGAYHVLKNSTLLNESWDLAAVKYPVSRQTGNWWNVNPPGDSQIDHIFTTSVWNVKSRGVLWDNFNGILPSDHFPVMAEITLP